MPLRAAAVISTDPRPRRVHRPRHALPASYHDGGRIWYAQARIDWRLDKQLPVNKSNADPGHTRSQSAGRMSGWDDRGGGSS